jgi:hypothetical protein
MRDNVPVNATAIYSEFDGLGNYRRRVTGGTFDAGNVRTEFTNYNPDQGVFSVNPSTNTQAGGYAPLAPSKPWILGTSTHTWEQEGASRMHTETCFEAATGFLGWVRSFRNSSGPQPTDVLTRFTRDVCSAGNIASEEYYGADFGGLPATTQDATCSLFGLPSTQYRIVHTYQAGSRKTSRYTRADGTPLTLFPLNLTIDPITGWKRRAVERLISSRDPRAIQERVSKSWGDLSVSQRSPSWQSDGSTASSRFLDAGGMRYERTDSPRACARRGARARVRAADQRRRVHGGHGRACGDRRIRRWPVFVLRGSNRGSQRGARPGSSKRTCTKFARTHRGPAGADGFYSVSFSSKE